MLSFSFFFVLGLVRKNEGFLFRVRCEGGLCLNHAVQKGSRGVLGTRTRVERTSEIGGNVNMADYP